MRDRSGIRGVKWDVVLAACAFAVGSAASYSASGTIAKRIYEHPSNNSWFSSDVARVTKNVTRRDSNHDRTKVHPLFSLWGFGCVLIVEKISGVPTTVAVRAVVALVAGAWAAGAFLLLRAIPVRRFDGAVLTALLMSSSASMFWLIVPETYGPASITIMVGLGVAAVAARRGAAAVVIRGGCNPDHPRGLTARSCVAIF